MKKPLKRARYTNQMAYAVWKIQQRNKQRSASDALCNIYLFTSDNDDSFQFGESFSGEFKLILAATSETGLHPDIIAGREGDFVVSTDLINDAQWNQYSLTAIDLAYIVDSSFNGVIGGYAKDDAWFSVNMGIFVIEDLGAFAWSNQWEWN